MITPDPSQSINKVDPCSYPVPVRAVYHILNFLKWRFSLLPVGAYHWVPGSDMKEEQPGSEIFLTTDTPVRSTVLNSRPGITVLRGGIVHQGMGIGNLMHADPRTGGRSYLDLMPVTVIANVLSRLPFVAERLAGFVDEQIFTFSEEIVKTEPAFVYCGQRASISAPSPAGTLVDEVKPGWCVVSVAIPVFMQIRTSKMPLNRPVLNRTPVKVVGP